MPDRSRQKERKRLKRKRKQESLRKIASISPFKAISRLPAEVQCWTNSNWKQTRQASIFVLRQTRSGRCAVANFLVDFGISGLKDVWGRFDLTSTEFFDDFLKPFGEQFPLKEIDADQAGRLIAGGIRFAHGNGFRLPHRYERWLSLLGDIGDWHQADVSDFEMEFAGSLGELRRRLIGQSVDEFMARRDVRIVLSNGPDELFHDENINSDGMKDLLARDTAEGIRQSFIASGVTPSRLLDRAVALFTEAMAKTLLRVEEHSQDQGGARELDAILRERLAELVLLEPLEDCEEVLLALSQVAAALSGDLQVGKESEQIV